MWIMLLFFTFISVASDFSSERYCFQSQGRANLAKQKFSMIQVPSDIVNTDEQCLVVQMLPHRRELIQRYFISTFPDTSISFSSEDIRRDPCRLRVEKEKVKSTDDLNIELSKKQGQIIKIDTKVLANEVMEIETVKDFEFSVNQEEIKGTCRVITPLRYAVVIEIKKNPKTIISQGLSPTPVIIGNQNPPDQETSTIKTELHLQKGERVNVGEVVRKLKDKEHTLDVGPSVNAEAGQMNFSERVWLSLQ